ncbi:MAG: hypothetical protein Q4F05_03210 [bacterium]|nr:hypothetical protein [bacterium]
MFLANLSAVTKEVMDRFAAVFPLQDVTPRQYAYVQYPKVIALMRFQIKQYKAGGFGNVMVMNTKAVGGMMELATIVFTPTEGIAMPLLLLDGMLMPKKREAVCFVEYYDCTKDGVTDTREFNEVALKYKEYPEYKEDPAWYVSRRTPYSLIKSDRNDNQGHGVEMMMLDTIDAYVKTAKAAPKEQQDFIKLREFQQKMIKLGNPSTSTLEKVLGKRGAEIFFETVVMPLPQ